jgi:predicted CXXCH cytochrome family protein
MRSPARKLGWLAVCLGTLGWSLLAPHPARVLAADATASPQLTHPDAACAGCHRAIYDRYEKTPMAQGSGLAMDALDAGSMHHAPSGIDYRVFARDGSAWMSFARPAASGSATPGSDNPGSDNPGSATAGSATPGSGLQGERQLMFFVGSGHRGRTYLYQQDGAWFELPINFYTHRNTWDMAPAYDNVTTMPAALPVDPNCLHCHATQVQPSLPEARNRFASAPFREGGIGCSACHGDPTEHLAKQGHGAILNPDRLSPARRDSACTQCHLEGEAVVYRPGRSLAQFRPGDDLADTAVYFVRASQLAGGARATSQYEALLRSACKRASGDRLTCTSCHDPHASPAPAERVPYFRARCLACHTGEKMAAAHHPEQPDCAHCHMPTRNTTDISHEQVTDHDIEARPDSAHLLSLEKREELVPVGGVKASDAEYGMAYAQLAKFSRALHGSSDRDEALRLLTRAAQAGPLEPEAEVQLGFLRQLNGQAQEARAAYVAALRQHPYEPVALANLGVLDASSGRVQEGVRLLDRLIRADPSQTAAGLNLAYIECKLGRPGEAKELLDRLARINPDDPELRGFRDQGSYNGQRCDLVSAEK